jgi:hypothetical protein
LNKQILPSIGDWDEFNERLAEETDAGLALFAASRLDLQLRHIIADCEPQETNGSGKKLRDDFGPRIEFVHRLGFITQTDYYDLNLIRNIRNEFAHGQYSRSFDEPDILQMIQQLKVPKDVSAEDVSSPRSRFAFVVHALEFILDTIRTSAPSGRQNIRSNIPTSWVD